MNVTKGLLFNTPINTNDQSLDRVLANPLPVLLVLSANGLDPDVQSMLEQVARDRAGKLLVARVNTKENPKTTRRFHADGSPVAIAWKGKTEQERISILSPEHVRALADHLLGLGPAPHVTPPRPQPKVQPTAESGEPVSVSEATFEKEVLRYPQPVLVDFWAPWCGPCRMIAPTLEKLSREYAGRLRVAKLNVDQNQRLAAQFGVQGIPMLMIFKGGKPVQQIVGAQPESNLRRFIEHTLSH